MKKSLYLTWIGLAATLFTCPIVTQAQITLNRVGVGASYWQPSLDYRNKRSLLTDYNSGKGVTLDGRVTSTAALDLGLFKDF